MSVSAPSAPLASTVVSVTSLIAEPCSESEPAPPSTLPVIFELMLKVSLPEPPLRFAKSVKSTPATSPSLVPVTVKMAPTFGPVRLSFVLSPVKFSTLLKPAEIPPIVEFCRSSVCAPLTAEMSMLSPDAPSPWPSNEPVSAAPSAIVSESSSPPPFRSAVALALTSKAS